MRNTINCYKGFTLIELMIVVAIAAIVAAVAMPSYQSYVQKSRRSDAMVALSGLQLAEEKYRASSTNYGTLAQVGVSGTSSGGYYTITVTNPTATGYTLAASAVTTLSQNSDTSCNPMTLTQVGANTTYSPSACWKK
jgi:type IV pilus assembly protein PilE